jgi:hypothetical protein
MGQQEAALMLKRASASRTSGEWNDDDFDVLASGRCRWPHLQGQCSARRIAVDVDVDLPSPRRSHANPRVRCHPRGRDAGFRQELAARMIFQAPSALRRATDLP